MSRLVLLLLLAAASAPAQFRSFDIAFEDTGCVPCTESLQGRLERVRGVESATIDLEKGLIRLELAEGNRVRLGPLRARITQDGTRIERMAFTAEGQVERRDGKTFLALPAGAFEIEGETAVGPAELSGEIVERDDAFILRLVAP